MRLVSVVGREEGEKWKEKMKNIVSCGQREVLARKLRELKAGNDTEIKDLSNRDETEAFPI
jgi:hypothetical protein